MASSNLAHAQTAKPRPTDLELVALNGMFDEKDGLSVLRHALTGDVSPAPIAMVSSFGADSSVLLHMVAQINRTKKFCSWRRVSILLKHSNILRL